MKNQHLLILLLGLLVIMFSAHYFSKKQSNLQFIFIRHGDTNWHMDRLKESPVDEPLNETGRTQIKNTAQSIKPYLTDHESIIISSPLLRCKESAQIISEYLGIKQIIYDQKLREQHYGTFALVEDLNDTPPDAENSSDFRKRTRDAFNKILTLADKKRELPIVVSHSGVFKIFAQMTNSPIKHIHKGQAARFYQEGTTWQVEIVS